jgi:Periplasmic binding protein
MRGLARLVRVAAAALAVALAAGCGSSLQEGGQGAAGGPVKVGLLVPGPGHAAGKEATAGFRETFEAAGGQVAGTELTPCGTTTNFQPYLARIQRSGARAAYCFYAGAEAVAFAKQYQQFRLASTIPLVRAGGRGGRRRGRCGSPRRASSPRPTSASRCRPWPCWRW